MPDRLGCLLQRGAGRDIVRIGVDLHMIERGDLLASERIELDDLLDLVPEEGDAPGGVLIVRGEKLDRVAAHAERPALEGGLVAFVLEGDQLPDDLARVVRLPLGEAERHRSEEHTSELQSLMRISYAVFCLKKKK